MHGLMVRKKRSIQHRSILLSVSYCELVICYLKSNARNLKQSVFLLSSHLLLSPLKVQIRVKLLCQTLVEDQFKRIISDNYYRPNKFWFELDYAQASKLMSLLASLAIAPSSSIPRHDTNNWSNRYASLREENEETVPWPPSKGQFNSSLKTLGPAQDFPSSSADSQYFENFPLDITSGETSEKELLLSKLQSIVLNDGLKEVSPKYNSQDSSLVHEDSPMEQNFLQTPTETEEGREDSSELSYDNNMSIKKVVEDHTKSICFCFSHLVYVTLIFMILLRFSMCS